MKIIHLQDEQKDYFAALDPFEYFEEYKGTRCICLGCVEEEDGSDIPAGLMICLPDKRMPVVRWIYVDPKYRGRGVGDMLLSAGFDMAKNVGSKFLGAYFSKDYGRKFVCPDEDEYFKYNGFDRSIFLKDNEGKLLVAELDREGEYGDEDVPEPIPYDYLEDFVEKISHFEEEYYQTTGREALTWDEYDPEVLKEKADISHKIEKDDIIVSYEDIKKCGILTMENDNENVRALSDISLPKLSSCLDACLKAYPFHYEGIRLEAYPPTWFEADISSCVFEGDKAVGLFLVHRDEEGVFWTEYLHAIGNNSKKNAVGMLRRSTAAFLEKYKKDSKIVIKIVRPETKALAEKLFS